MDEPEITTPRIEYRVTFPESPHPAPELWVGPWVSPAGWVAIVAPSYDEAVEVAHDLFDTVWLDLVDADALDPALYPRGELLRVIVPPGVIETEDHR